MNRNPDDPLEAMLVAPYLDDAGFTARVLDALPARRRARLRPLILLAATLLAGLCALVLGPGGQAVLAALSAFTTVVRGGPVDLGLLTPALVLVATAAVLWVCAAPDATD